MLIKDLENALKNIENDSMLMSYGDNLIVVNNILSIINIIQTLSSIIKGDRNNSMLKMSLQAKVMELENIVLTQGVQLLMERGINVGIGQSVMNPMQNPMMMYNPMSFNPMMQTQMFNPMMQQAPMYNPMMQQAPMQQMQMPQQPQMQPQSAPQPQPAPQPAPQPTPQPAPQPQPAPEPAPQPTSQPSSKPSSAGFSLPGLGGSEEKAAGRDFLLKLLEER